MNKPGKKGKHVHRWEFGPRPSHTNLHKDVLARCADCPREYTEKQLSNILNAHEKAEAGRRGKKATRPNEGEKG